MKSMTGYGKREMIWKGIALGVEIRSVNHRFCEIVPRLPKGLGGLEEELRQIIHRHCERGRIEYTVLMNGTTGRPKTLTLDHAMATQYHHLLQDLQREYHLEGRIDVGLVAGFRDVVSVTEPVIEEGDAKPVLKRLMSGALADLNHMRSQEGKNLLSDMTGRLKRIRNLLGKIKGRIPHAVQGHFDRMKVRVQKLLGNEPQSQDRLHQELAVYADRCDVTEELTRLQSHLAQFHKAIREKRSMGRRLDFLLQEMGREVNTIGSKANDAEIALHIVEIKSELEKIREQVQNIE
jgi:uncharacterized protein (TIGR00255 family)